MGIDADFLTIRFFDIFLSNGVFMSQLPSRFEASVGESIELPRQCGPNLPPGIFQVDVIFSVPASFADCHPPKPQQAIRFLTLRPLGG